MSNNFRGVTFAEQGVKPADDAVVRRAILPDGVLTGCKISYSGSTLTMAAGYIIACGRTFQHIAAQNWAVVDATSGFARLVLTIDLTKTATKDTFDQIDSAIEYATSEDGFMSLDQQDINQSGIRYQIAACVVSLGTGGITGIVSQMEKSRAEGGGLNFRVVGGETQPNDRKENDIWVITPVKIPAYYLQSDQPAEMAEGEVWISTGTASSVAFNATKKNAIMIYPIAAKQMVGGALVDVKAQSYQNGKWVDWAVFMFKDGKDITDVTGGWAGYAATPLQYAVAPNVEIADGQLHIYYTGMGIGGSGIGATKKMVDLSNANTLHFVVDSISDFINAKVGVWTISNTVATLVRGNDDVTTAGAIMVDVKDLSGSYYVGAMIGRKSGEGRVDIYFSEIRYE